MTLNDARKYTLLREITRQLSPFMATEAIEILARATAEVMVRDPSQYKHFANVFGSALDREYTYLSTRHRAQSAHREGVS
jgi:hypothetical protein